MASCDAIPIQGGCKRRPIGFGVSLQALDRLLFLLRSVFPVVAQRLFDTGSKQLQFRLLARGENVVRLQNVVAHQRRRAVSVGTQLIQEGVPIPGFLSKRGARHGHIAGLSGRIHGEAAHQDQQSRESRKDTSNRRYGTLHVRSVTGRLSPQYSAPARTPGAQSWDVSPRRQGYRQRAKILKGLAAQARVHFPLRRDPTAYGFPGREGALIQVFSSGWDRSQLPPR